MTDAPERIWAEPDGDNILVHNGDPALERLIATGYLYEYIRADLCADPGMLDPAYPPKHCFTAWNRRAALPARGVGVKPLVWREMRTPTGVEAYDAQSLIGRFKAQKSPTVDYAICVAPEGGITRHSNLDAAKSAAQADYATRILAALEPAPAPTDAAQAREAALREARVEGWNADVYEMDRSQQFKDGAAWGIRKSIAWLHHRAEEMNDPHAKAILDAAATNLGMWKGWHVRNRKARKLIAREGGE